MTVDRLLSSPALPSNEPGSVLIETPNLIIRRWSISDAPALAKAANYPSIVVNLRDRFPSPFSLADAEAYLTHHTVSPEGYPTAMAIFVKPNSGHNTSDEPLFIGGAGLESKGDVYYRTWELGYWFTPSAWGKGYATEFVKALVPWAFETWPRLNRIEAMAYERNEASQKVLRKCGFVREGMRRGALEKQGEILDESIWGILRSDIKQ
ncbi:acyl-CoA N-acyltransferase [Trichoderma sp. SZMC 28014]